MDLSPSTIDWTRTGALAAAVLGALVGLVIFIWAVRRPRERRADGRAIEAALTLAAAGIATGVAATGMWRFFSDVLEISSVPLRIALFAFLEIALFVSALRARRNLLDDIARQAERPSTGIDGKAVWGLAALSGLFAAMDARSLAEALFRVGAPLVAAWLWERGLAAHRRRARGGRSTIHWRVTPERILVWLRLAEPTGRGVGEVDAARRRAAVVRASARADRLRRTGAWGWRISLAEKALDRRVAAANLDSDAAGRALVREGLATLTQARAGLTAAAVADLSPWAASAEQAAEPPAAAEQEPVRVPQPPEAPVSPPMGPLTGNVVPLQEGQEVWVRPDRPLVAAAVANHYRETDPALSAVMIGKLMGRGVSTVRSYFRERTGSWPTVKVNGKGGAELAAETRSAMGFQAPPNTSA